MIRKLMASTAVLALMSTGAFTIAQAQESQTNNSPVIEEQAQTTAPATEAEPTTELAASEAVLTPDEPTFATAYIGKSVYSSEDPESDNIGDINDLILSEDGSITHAVVGVGGFLGIGEKDVAVPFDELKLVEQDGDIRFVYASTREDLEAAPALDRTAFDPEARAAEEQAASTDAGTDTLAPAPAEPSQDMAAAPAEEPAPVTAEEPAADVAAAPAEETAPATAEEPAQDMASAPAAEEPAATTDEQTAMADTEAPADAATTAEQDLVASSETTAEPVAPAGEQFVTFAADQIHASDLIGKAVYSGEESIGEISDLIFQTEGETRAALIDVGGFLGVGEKTVGIPFEKLQISKAEDGSEQVTVAMSKEELEQLPAIELPTEAAAVEQPLPEATAPAAGDEPQTTGSVAPAVPFEAITQDVAASKLMGATVYTSDESSIGEVSDVLFTETGDIQAAVIDVGGFLGMGEKPVAVGFDKLQIRDESGSLSVMVSASKEELDAAPTYEEPVETTTVQ